MIIESRRPTMEDIPALRVLAGECESEEGISIDIGWDSLPDDDSASLWICNGDMGLPGAGLVFRMGGTPEVMLMVSPSERRQGIGDRLLYAIIGDCRSRGEDSILLMNDRRSRSGAGFIKHTGAAHVRSEYRMEHSVVGAAGTAAASLQGMVRLVEAAYSDLSGLVDGRMEGFGIPEENRKATMTRTLQRLKDPNCSVYFITHAEGLVVGQLVLSFEAWNPYIYGLCILPGFQGQGLGSAALRQAVGTAALKSPAPVRLEVETTNENALKVYERSGFKTIAAFDYHGLRCHRV